MTRIPMTRQGKRKLQEELDHLKKVERPKVVDEIEVARAHGDLSENAEYHAAKERQSFIEGRIQELQAKISNAQVIDIGSLSGDRVMFGATVTIYDFDKDEEVTYKIVGDDESDIKENKISFASPIAKAMIGKEVAQEVQIKTPGGTRTVEIVDVEFIE
ncbi:MAG: transcription elongation factor GreA [Myxococcota bacterium]